MVYVSKVVPGTGEDRFETPARPEREFGDDRPNKAVGVRTSKARTNDDLEKERSLLSNLAASQNTLHMRSISCSENHLKMPFFPVGCTSAQAARPGGIFANHSNQRVLGLVCKREVLWVNRGDTRVRLRPLYSGCAAFLRTLPWLIVFDGCLVFHGNCARRIDRHSGTAVSGYISITRMPWQSVTVMRSTLLPPGVRMRSSRW